VLLIAEGAAHRNLDLISIPDRSFTDGKLTLAAFDLHRERLCSTPEIFAFTVGFNSERQGSRVFSLWPL
jgi:hypothetical protein